jgi:inorganic pyrophosphatase
MSEHDQEVQEVQENVQEIHRPVPRLNERILSSLSRRSVAAHPWHDLEIGILIEHVTSLICALTQSF